MPNAPAKFRQELPMPLEAAARAFFPHGGATKATLLAACRKGALAYAKIGNRYMVTEADIQGWIDQCRAKQSQQDCGSGEPQAAPLDTSSLTEAENTKLDAALAMRDALKQHCANTLPARSGQTQGNVIRIRSKFRKS